MATYTTDKIEYGGNVYNIQDANALVSSHYSNTNGSNSGKYYKISINSYTGWMLNFTVRIYHEYKAYDIQISGYNYGSSHWYLPAAVILGASVTNSIDVIFGYDSNYHLWVAIAAKQYSGIDVYYGTNGYQQVTDKKNLFTIELVTGIPETAQTTVTAYRPWYRNETIYSQANSNTTGISIANHGTTSIYGVGSTTTSVTGVSGSVTGSHVKSGGNGTAPTLGTAFTVPNVTAAGSGSFTATVSNHVMSFSHTHTAPTLGDAFTIPNVTSVGSASNWVFEDVTVPKAATSATTVPVKNSSATTVVTGASHTITDNGHTHTLS